VVKFGWAQLPGLFAPAPTAVLLVEFGSGAPALIGGIWDTGASVTTLVTNVEQPRLGVPDAQCVPMAFGVANGAKVWQKITCVTATLDGHQFRLPVAFADSVPINLIGRVGVVDQFEVGSDPLTHTTSFEWRGVPQLPSSQPWVTVWETYWTAMLDRRYSWTNWNANGRPDIPPTPTLPEPLPDMVP